MVLEIIPWLAQIAVFNKAFGNCIQLHANCDTKQVLLCVCCQILQFAPQYRKISGSEIFKLPVKLLSMKLDINGHEGNGHFSLTLILCIFNSDFAFVIRSVDVYMPQFTVTKQ